MFKNLLTALLFFALFSTLILTFSVHFLAQNGVEMDQVGGGALNLSEFEGSLEGTETQAENYRERFEDGDVDNIDDATGVFSILGDLVSMITSPFTLLAQVMENILGIPSIFTNTVLAILVVTLMLGGWRVLRSGD